MTIIIYLISPHLFISDVMCTKLTRNSGRYLKLFVFYSTRNVCFIFLWRNSAIRACSASLFRFLRALRTIIKTHSRYHSSERVNISSQRPLPTKHTRNTAEEGHAISKVPTRNPSSRCTSDYVLHRLGTWMDSLLITWCVQVLTYSNFFLGNGSR